jgi:hypothetical protein
MGSATRVWVAVEEGEARMAQEVEWKATVPLAPATAQEKAESSVEKDNIEVDFVPVPLPPWRS